MCMCYLWFGRLGVWTVCGSELWEPEQTQTLSHWGRGGLGAAEKLQHY